ncbi:MAG: family 20 glycosylhydrolase [Pyrinomonadaceae bacterium]|nr:family 20 glycosylhydrolase [Pyrinomonadaceae bacterium]
MKTLIFSLFLLSLSASFCFAQKSELNIIPQPKSVERLNGNFELNRNTKLAATDEEGRRLAKNFNDYLQKKYNFKLKITAREPTKNFIAFLPTSTVLANTIGKNETYFLRVEKNWIKMDGIGAGRFYALQSLLQMLPLEFKDSATIPAVLIFDQPRFQYRGMHLDVGRHFMPVEFVKKYIDLMAQYKFNQFHWHLTEDQGWRIEIKKYPKLTEIGSKRTESVKERNLQPYIGDGVPVSGFYTQEQIKDVVAYAKARKINVIPEIELPGHSSAALAAYPELGCKENYDYKVQTTWGIFKEVFCPTDKTFQFLEDVLSETIALFPGSPYIHIGGDEVLKDFWKESAFVQELKAKENLKDEHEVQSYFIRRIEKFINSKGRKIIGWDEILEGGIAPNATIMSWRGEKGGIESAKAKHDVIMTPNTFLYFDYGQGDPRYEPLNIGSYITLEKVYSYNPIPKELSADEAKYILGAQANVWTEYMKTPEAVEYMVFPRMLALAEVNWSPLESKNFNDFRRRLSNHYPRLDKQNVNYRIPEPINLQNGFLRKDECETCSAKLLLFPPIPNSKIFYTLDGSEPTEKSNLYFDPIEFTVKAKERMDLKTIVVLPTGRKSVTYAATFLGRKPLAAVSEPTDKKQGANLKFYKSELKSAKDFDSAAPTETRESKSIQLTQLAEKTNKLKDAFGAAFDGYIYAPEDAIYEFQVESTGGAVLQIGDEIVINAGKSATKQTNANIVPLAKGFHKINLRYFQNGGDVAAVLNLRWGIKGQGLSRIYGGELFH